MAHVDQLLQVLPEYQGQKRRIKRRQDTFDIIDWILNKHRETRTHYDRMAPMFWKGDPERTIRGLYDFAAGNLPYKAERTNDQTVKTPAAILQERYTFGNDCKHYASILVGLGQALSRAGHPIKCFYRFASYDPKDRNRPGHVFAVFLMGGKEIWLDPVPQVGGYNSRKIVPLYVIDKQPPGSSYRHGHIGDLYEISGVPNNHYMTGFNPRNIVAGLNPRTIVAGPGTHWLDDIPAIGRPSARRQQKKEEKKVKKDEKKQQRAVKKDDRQKKRTTNKAARKAGEKGARKLLNKVKPGKLVAKVGLSTGRNAFLVLTKLNTFNLAVKMWKGAAHDQNSPRWKELAAKWQKLGGNPSALYNNIKQGVNTHNKLHPKDRVSGYDSFEAMNGNDEVIGYISGLEGMGDTPVWIDGFYDDTMSIGAIRDYVHRCHNNRLRRSGRMGAAPVAAGLIAAAAPIMLALAGLLKAMGVNTNKASEAAEADTADLANQHEGGEENADGSMTAEDGTTTAIAENEDGTQDMYIKTVPGATPGTGVDTGSEDARDMIDTDGDGDADAYVSKDKHKKKIKKLPGTGPDFGMMLANIGDFVVEHKWWFIGGAALIGAIIIVPKLLPKKGRRR